MVLKIGKPLRKGDRVYHGSGRAERNAVFTVLKGPAWVTDSFEIAAWYSERAELYSGRRERRLVATYEVVRVPRLFIIKTTDDYFELINRLAPRSHTPHRVARALCETRLADGWHVPDVSDIDYLMTESDNPPSSDTMLCEPERWLQLVEVEEVEP